jgi:hypothetical protein
MGANMTPPGTWCGPMRTDLSRLAAEVPGVPIY